MQNPLTTGGFTTEISSSAERYAHHGKPLVKNFKQTLRDNAFWRIFRSDKQAQHTHSQITEQLELNFKQGD